MERLFQITIDYGRFKACYGIISENNTIVAAAPIAAWMVGKTLQKVKPWLLEKKAIVKEIMPKK